MVGSSPHTWRILNLQSQGLLEPRIISTYVENTTIFGAAELQFQDHLHIRGEYNAFSCSTVAYLGSSPHTWRIRLDLLSFLFSSRIISTYVENTLSKGILFSSQKDHLHIRGEYLHSKHLTSLRVGSSPHTWRIRTLRKCKFSFIRIISTYVENTVW